MSAQEILEFRDDILREIMQAESDGGMEASDPEIWEHLLADAPLDFDEYEADGTDEEKDAFENLMQVTMRMSEEALLNSDLVEAGQVFKYQVTELLTGIADTCPALGGAITAFMQEKCTQHEDEGIAEAARDVVRHITGGALMPDRSEASQQARADALSRLRKRTTAAPKLKF